MAAAPAAVRRLRVLGLPGWRTSAEVLRFQLQGLLLALRGSGQGDGASRDDVELTCLDPALPASGPPYASVSAFFGAGGPYFEWFDFDEASQSCVGLERSCEHVLAFARERGPFDVLVGFSQGAAVLSLVQSRVERTPALLAPHLRWRLSVFIGGVPVRDRALAPACYDAGSLGALCPTLHLIGEADPYQERCEALHASFFAARHGGPARTEVLRYPEGHAPPTWRQSQAQLRAAARAVRNAARGPRWFALDFDGVLCDSARETCLAGLRAGEALGLFDSVEVRARTEQLVAAFRTLRPLLEFGSDAVALSHLMLRELAARSIGAGESSAAAALAAELALAIRAQGGLAPQLAELAARGAPDAALKKAMYDQRVAWIARDRAGWLAENRWYDRAVLAAKRLLAARERVYIITTKHRDFLLPLLAAAGLDFPPERLFGLGEGAKEAVLARLAAGPERGRACLFLEDRVDTLVRVAAADTARLHEPPQPPTSLPPHPHLPPPSVVGEGEPLAPLRFGLARWGYNEPVDEALAREHRFDVFATQDDFLGFVDHYLAERQHEALELNAQLPPLPPTGTQ